MRQEAHLLADRYLPLRLKTTRDNHMLVSCSDTDSTASSHLDLMSNSSSRTLSFRRPHPSPSSTVYSFAQECQMMKDKARRMERTRKEKIEVVYPEHVIEATGAVNNFYNSCLDASASGLLAIGLQDGGFFYNKKTCLEIPTHHALYGNEFQMTCVRFNRPGTILSTADSQGSMQLIDVEKIKLARKIGNHSSRIGCIENAEEWGILTGSKDMSVVLNDVRVKNSKVLSVLAHHSEVCGLTKQNNSIASSDSRGNVSLWDLRQKELFTSHRLFKKSAVKAIQWCPWKHGILALAGGSKEHLIQLWNTSEGRVEKSVNGGNQTTQLRWKEDQRLLVTTHGSGNGAIWDMEKGTKKAVLVGHQDRIIGLTEENGSLWTLGADETLRNWKFGPNGETEIKKEKCESVVDFKLK